jgi:hypothetical protein
VTSAPIRAGAIALADPAMHAQAGATFDDGGHPPHDLTDPAQLREHLAAGWRVMRDNRAVMTALFESAMAAGPALTSLLSHGLAGPAACPPVPR